MPRWGTETFRRFFMHRFGLYNINFDYAPMGDGNHYFASAASNITVINFDYAPMGDGNLFKFSDTVFYY